MKDNAVSLDNLSTEELERVLAQRKHEENEKLRAERKEYEDARERIVNELGTRAFVIMESLELLKGDAFKDLKGFRERMMKYGDIRNGDRNKGNFEIKNDKFKIMFSSQINKRFDERAELAEQKLREFLEGFVKKQSQKTYKLVKSLLERNPKTEDYDISLINRLYAMEEEFDDPNWKEAIKLFKESYSPTGTAQYVRFFKKNENNGWDAIVLDFAKNKITKG